MARTGNPSHAIEPGRLIWITGLPGTGKTTIAHAVAARLRSENRKDIVVLDGDAMREALGVAARYLPDERLALALAYAGLCRLLVDQGQTVICATVSMFDEVRHMNKVANKNYLEVFVEASDEVRLSRKPALIEGGPENLVSPQNRRYQLPRSADLVLNNDGNQPPDALGKMIVDRLRQVGAGG